MKCIKCGGNDALMSVEFIVSNGTTYSTNLTIAKGRVDTNFSGQFSGMELKQNTFTGREFHANFSGESTAHSYQSQESFGHSSTRLADTLSNLFGPYLEPPTILLTESAKAEFTKQLATKKKYISSSWMIGLGWVGLELVNTGLVFWSVFLGWPVALILAGIGWLKGYGAESKAIELSRNSKQNKERVKVVEKFNEQLSHLYAWLSSLAYCSRCNVVNDESEFFELQALASARPFVPSFD